MRKAFFTILTTTLILIVAGCNKEEAPASTGTSSEPATAAGKGNDQVGTAEMTLGPGAADAEKRVGSQLNGR